MSTATAQPTDRFEERRKATNDKILTAARKVLAEDGFAGFTIEKVAVRSGVAKTTIYRRWDRALDLAADLLAEDANIDVASFVPPLRREAAEAVYAGTDMMDMSSPYAKALTDVLLASAMEGERHE